MPASPEPGLPERTPGRLPGELLAFAEDLRAEGLAVGTSEILDSFAALELVEWGSQTDFRESMAATLAKSPEDRRVFELVFDRFFFRSAEAEAARRRITEGGDAIDGQGDVNLDTLRQQIAAALRDGSDAAMRDLARLAIAAFGQGEGSGVLGVDVQRIRRALGLRVEPQPDLPSAMALAGLILLLWEPGSLYDPGFQLSFVSVIALVGTMPLFEPYLQTVLGTCPTTILVATAFPATSCGGSSSTCGGSSSGR